MPRPYLTMPARLDPRDRWITRGAQEGVFPHTPQKTVWTPIRRNGYLCQFARPVVPCHPGNYEVTSSDRTLHPATGGPPAFYVIDQRTICGRTQVFVDAANSIVILDLRTDFIIYNTIIDT